MGLTIVDTGGDTVDTTDIPTDTGSVKQHPLKKPTMPSKNDLVMPKLMPAPNLTTTDTTDIPTDGAVTTDTDTTDIVTDTVTDTGVKFYHPKHASPTQKRHHSFPATNLNL